MGGQKVAVVGIGAVGQEMLRCLETSKLNLADAPRVLARTERDIELDGKTYRVEACTPQSFDGIDIALFAGTEGEKGAAVTFATDAMKRGATVIDNGADFRMTKGVPLVVPEVNPEALDAIRNAPKLIASPNCSTIQMVVALKPLHDVVKLRRILVSTYQAVSGAGTAAIEELESQTHLLLHNMELSEFTVHNRQIAFNVLSGAWRFEENGYTAEELKMIYETHKIFNDDSIPITVTCVRVPVQNAHAESIYIETEQPIEADAAREILRNAKGVTVIDDILEDQRSYPAPIDASGKDDVFVGRVRNDLSNKHGLWLWVVADNLRKGAALNTVQIAESLIERDIL